MRGAPKTTYLFKENTKRNWCEHYRYNREETKEPDGFIRRALDIGEMAIIR